MLKSLSKYKTTLIMSVVRKANQKKQLLIRVLIYILIVSIYSQIFKKVTQDILRLWYIGVTQWVIGSIASVAITISNDILSGQFIYYSLRPINYVLYRFYDAMGITFIKSIVLGVCFGIQIYLLTGSFPFNIYKCFMGTILVLLSTSLFNLILIFIGLLSYWTREIRGLVYTNLTASFCFGGLIVPLEFYSETMRKIAFMTPYPWILGWPARFITQPTFNLNYSFLYWGIWFVVFIIMISILYNIMLKNLRSSG